MLLEKRGLALGGATTFCHFVSGLTWATLELPDNQFWLGTATC